MKEELKIICFIDGLCEPAYPGGPANPGGVATFGYFVKDDQGRRLAARFGIVGAGEGMSNNVAEYTALIRTLFYLRKERKTEEVIEIRSDSKLVVEQMKGNWKARRGLYLEKSIQAKRLSAQFEHLTFKWIPREDNEKADSLSRKAYNQYLESSAAEGV